MGARKRGEDDLGDVLLTQSFSGNVNPICSQKKNCYYKLSMSISEKRNILCLPGVRGSVIERLKVWQKVWKAMAKLFWQRCCRKMCKYPLLVLLLKDAIALAGRGIKHTPPAALAVDLLPTLKASAYCDLILLFVFVWCTGLLTLPMLKVA